MFLRSIESYPFGIPVRLLDPVGSCLFPVPFELLGIKESLYFVYLRTLLNAQLQFNTEYLNQVLLFEDEKEVPQEVVQVLEDSISVVQGQEVVHIAEGSCV